MQFEAVTGGTLELRMVLEGPPGSGKTYTALEIATALVADPGSVFLIDSECNSAKKYRADFPHFKHGSLDSCSPKKYREAIAAAEKAGAKVIVIDSLSHAWAGKDGALEQVDKIGQRTGNKFGAWKDVTPEYNQMIDAIIRSKCHIIATLRVKVDYVLEENSKGRQAPRRVGTAPIMREGADYEFDIVALMDESNNFTTLKTRCKALQDQVIRRDGKKVAEILRPWLNGTDSDAPVEARVEAPWEGLAGLEKRVREATAAAALTELVGEMQDAADKLTEEQRAALAAAYRQRKAELKQAQAVSV